MAKLTSNKLSKNTREEIFDTNEYSEKNNIVLNTIPASQNYTHAYPRVSQRTL
ncbi:MAG: hypothetical protein RLZZ337_2055 [Bacteroidota bacterium]|jgi:hypothetical protein